MNSTQQIKSAEADSALHAESLLAFEAIFDFHAASGVNICLEESPQDRFAESARLAEIQARKPANLRVPAKPAKPRPGQGMEARPQKSDATIPDEAAMQNAREQAAKAKDLNELQELLGKFDGCNLKLTAKNLCFSDGNPEARVMLVGEAPGRDEDIQGKPFVGRSGQLLDKMLKAIGLDRGSVYIANTIPWRPPGNRTPSTQEIEICKPFITRQIELADPEILVCLGGASAQQLIGGNQGIVKTRGKWMKFDVGSKQISCIAMFHPAYLLRQPAQKKLAWRDMLTLKEALEKSNSK